MAFDIHQLDGLEYDEGEAFFETYQETLVGLFLEAREGQPFVEAYSDAGFWSSQLIFYGYGYMGVSIPEMKLRDVEEIMTDLMPRKISILSAEDAKGAVPELIAFWQFLLREYNLPQAHRIIRYLEKIKSHFPSMMMDSGRFGMAKSFFMAGQEAGFDMSSQEGMDSFMHTYNDHLAKPIEPEIVELPARHKDKTRTARKRKRKLVRSAHRRNKKRK